jgi:hypothetical protein
MLEAPESIIEVWAEHNRGGDNAGRGQRRDFRHERHVQQAEAELP